MGPKGEKEPTIPETPELTVPGIARIQVSSETGIQDAGGGGSPASGKSGPCPPPPRFPARPPSPAHVLVYKQQESEGAGDLPRRKIWEPKRILAAVGGLLLWLTRAATC